jgi:predicted transcriptional regulator
MSANELLHAIETLPKQEQIWLMEKLSELAAADIPDSFRQGMAEAERGELMDLDEALRELDRP